MKLAPEIERNLIREAMKQADGNRAAAAKALNMSVRSFYRHISRLNLGDEFDQRGWTAQPGPQRGKSKFSSALELRVVLYIRKHKGMIDFQDLTTDLYGISQSDTAPREWVIQVERVMNIVSKLVDRGRIAVRDDKWVILDEKAVKA